MLKSKQMSLEAVNNYAINPDTGTPSTLPELVYIDDEQKIPSGTLEYFIVSEAAEDTQDYLEILLQSVYPNLYFNQMEEISPVDEVRKFPMYYLMFRRRKFSSESYSSFDVKTQAWNDILENLRQFINANKSEFGMRNDLESMDKYDKTSIDSFERDYTKRVEQFKKQYEKKLAPREEFDKLPNNAVFTEPQTIKAFISYAYRSPMDIKELFNAAQVTREIPFLTCAPFFKIYNGAKIFPIWNVSEEDSLTGYVRVEEDADLPESYSQFQLTESIIRIESYSRNQIESSGTRVLQAIRSMFPMLQIEMEDKDDEKVEKIVEEELYVETFFVDMDLNLTLFKHFVCTNTIMKNFYFIDESVYLVKKKNYILLNYFVEPDKPISLFIGNRYLEKQEMVESINLDANRCHTRLYVRRCNRNNLFQIISDMSRCLLLFQTQRERLTSEFLGLFSDEVVNKPYRDECPRRGQADSEKKDEFALLWKDAVKRSSHKPTIVNQVQPNQYLINPQDTEDPSVYAEQGQDNTEQKQEVLYYPSKKDSDKLPQRFYTCNLKEFQYIGLTENKETKAVALEFIPNCFKVSQSPANKPTSKLSAYLSGEKKESSSTAYVIKTGKQLLRKQVGEMLELVDKWTAFFYPSHRLFRFGLVDYENKSTPKFGVDSKYRSSSVLYLLEYYLRGNFPSQVDIKAIRKRLVDRVRTQTIYTAETFRYSRQELEDILVNNHFIDPRLFYHILKDEYQCELFMFTKDEKKSKTPFYLTCSYFHNDYVEVETAPVNKFIMIAINKGGEFDQDDFPICEIVADKKATSELSNIDVTVDKYNYPVTHPYYKEFNKTITDLYGKRMLFHPFTAQPVAQSLNTFGKVAWLHFKSPSQRTISMRLYVPIHSLELPIWEGQSYQSEEKAVEQFLESEPGVYVSSRMDARGKVMGMFVKKEMGKVEYRYYIPYGEKPQYLFQTYQDYEKISRMVMEYTYYLFSIFLREKGVVAADDMYPLYKEFSDNHFRIEPVSYRMMERRWTLNGNPMLQPTPELEPPYQIVVPNDQVKVKLMYLLRQKFFTNPEGLLNYHQLTYMPNYYTSIADFDSQPKTILFEKEENLEQYQRRMNQEIEPGVFELQMEATKPYMFYRLIPELGHHTFLIQPARSLPHAVFICDHWNKKGVNAGDQDYELEAPSTKFVWTSEYEYSIYTEKGGEQRFVIVVNNGTSITYQSMLPYKVI